MTHPLIMISSMTNYVYFDAVRPNLAHTRIDCPNQLGLLEEAESLGYDVTDPDVMEAVADLLGLAVPAEFADRATPCGHCTLVAAPLWRAAA
jgi:hypothetical protein